MIALDTTIESAPATAVTEHVQQFLVFSLGEEHYGIEIEFVQEIKGLAPITPLPNSPEYVRGVLNLRGLIIPILDLRVRLGMSERAYDRFNVIIVVAVEEKLVGLVVDSVLDVTDIAAGDIEDPPLLTTDMDTTCFRGVGKTGDRLVFLLDVEQLIGLQDLASVCP